LANVVVALPSLLDEELGKPGDVELVLVVFSSIVRLLHGLVDSIGDLVCEVWAYEQVPSNLLLLITRSFLWTVSKRERDLEDAIKYDSREINVVASNAKDRHFPAQKRGRSPAIR